MCVYFLSSLHAPAQTLSPHSFSLSLFFSLSRSLDADIINIRLVICFPKYFMQCCVYSSISERLVYSLFVCFVSYCFVSFAVIDVYPYSLLKVQVYFFISLTAITAPPPPLPIRLNAMLMLMLLLLLVKLYVT